MTYQEALTYLDSFKNYEKIGPGKFRDRDAVARMDSILSGMGSPHKAYRTVHIAGTKGKGSVSAFVSSVLRASGARTGTYTSPHLSDIRERITVDGVRISKDMFSDMIGKYKNLICPEKCTFFEALTAVCFEYFRRQQVDIAVIETGLGGRLDATNVLEPEVCAITPVSYDHMEALGHTIEEIAAEKAAIIKKGAHCVSAYQEDGARYVIAERCRQEGVPLTVIGDNIRYDLRSVTREGSVVDLRGERELRDCRISMRGDFQAANAALAWGICEQLSPPVDDKSVRTGLKNAYLPGRMEAIGLAPLVVVDGAQNAASAEALKEAVKKIYPERRMVLVLGISSDKDIKGICDTLVPVADEIVLTKASTPRAADPALLRGYMRGRKAHLTYDAREALGRAFLLSSKSDMILVTGSFYLVGEIRDMVLGKKEHVDRCRTRTIL